MKSCFVFKGRKSESNIDLVPRQDLQGQNYPNCQEHIKNLCTLYCEQCDTSICDLCGTSEKHLTHDVSNISSIIERKKKTLHEYLMELETSLFPKYQEYVDNIPVQKADLVKHSRKLTIDLDKQEEDWHRQIDAIIKKQKYELEEMHSKQLAKLNKQEEEIADIISKIKHSITELKDVLESNNVGIVFAYKPRNEKFRRLPPKLTISLPKINKEQLCQQFRSLVPLLKTTDDTSYTMDTSEARSSPLKAFCDESQITTTIQTECEDVENSQRSVTCHSDNKIWTCRLDNIMRLYNLHGQLVNSIKTKSGNMPQDIAVTWSGDLVYTDCNDRTVNVVKDTQIHQIKLRGWIPWGVCSTSFGDLLVAMNSDDDKETKIARFSGSTEKQSIQYDDQGNSLFLSGIYICENGNLDICVSDNSAGAVVVVNMAGELRFKYTGCSISFRPYGIATDSQNLIMIVDSLYDCIHILDQNGQFLRYINCLLQYPWGICVDSRDNVFVSEYNTGKIKKIQYYV